MLFIADTHTHIYPGFRLDLFFSCLVTNFAEIKSTEAGLSGAAAAICLTERADCGFFRILADKPLGIPGFKIIDKMGDRALNADFQGQEILIVGGRQFKTAEKLEVLALGRSLPPRDNMSLEETINYARSEGAIPVLPWAFGKWLGARLKLVEQAVSSFGSGVILADSSMRPALWPMPKVMLEFSGNIVAGTDPLPLKDEETRVGRLASVLDSADAPGDNYGKFMCALTNPANRPRTVGKRLSAAAALQKVLRLSVA